MRDFSVVCCSVHDESDRLAQYRAIFVAIEIVRDHNANRLNGQLRRVRRIGAPRQAKANVSNLVAAVECTDLDEWKNGLISVAKSSPTKRNQHVLQPLFAGDEVELSVLLNGSKLLKGTVAAGAYGQRQTSIEFTLQNGTSVCARGSVSKVGELAFARSIWA